MLKQIPKSDINLRPFKVYKTFPLSPDVLSADVAVNHNSSSSNLTDVELSENGLYHQLKTMYYNGDNALNPFLSFGDFKPKYTHVIKQISLMWSLLDYELQSHWNSFALINTHTYTSLSGLFSRSLGPGKQQRQCTACAPVAS